MRRRVMSLEVQRIEREGREEITLGDVRTFLKMCEAAQIEYSTPVIWAPTSDPQVGMHASRLSIEEDD